MSHQAAILDMYYTQSASWAQLCPPVLHLKTIVVKGLLSIVTLSQHHVFDRWVWRSGSLPLLLRPAAASSSCCCCCRCSTSPTSDCRATADGGRGVLPAPALFTITLVGSRGLNSPCCDDKKTPSEPLATAAVESPSNSCTFVRCSCSGCGCENAAARTIASTGSSISARAGPASSLSTLPVLVAADNPAGIGCIDRWATCFGLVR